jgi:hypothetical protein
MAFAVRDTLGTAIYFMVYESGKQIGNTVAGDHPNSNKVAVVASGGMCGLVSWAMICKLCNPTNDSFFTHTAQIQSILPRASISETHYYTRKAKRLSLRQRLNSLSVTCIGALVSR